jgi:hypothetical protein
MITVQKPNPEVHLVPNCKYSFYDELLGKNVTATYQSTYGKNHLFVKNDDGVVRNYSFTDSQLRFMSRLNMKQVSFPKEKKIEETIDDIYYRLNIL